MCNHCLGKQRFAMEVEFEHPNLDYGVLISNTLGGLMLEFKQAKKDKWHPSLGGCPNIKILSITDVIDGKYIDEKKALKLLEQK
tara:strand:+ start:3450 stop:3701 length:252 start_codon:yes stop_codon:yes gene_type:complete